MRSLEYPIQFRARGDGLGVPHSGQCNPHGYIMEPHLEQKIRWEYSRRRQKEESPKPQPPQQGQDDDYPRVQEGIGYQVFRPGMVRLVHEGFRTDGILRYVRKLAYVFFTHVPQRPRGKPLLYGNGFFHDWTCRVRHKNSISRKAVRKTAAFSIGCLRRNR